MKGLKMSFKKKNVSIQSDGYPAICVPITGTTKEEIISEARECIELDKKVTLIEWRLDMFKDWKDIKSVSEISKEIHDLTGEDRLLILTLRTTEEGGEAKISGEAYRDYLYGVAENSSFDLLDVQYFCLPKPETETVEELHRKNAHIIASHHDFTETPAEEVMENHLVTMKEGGADIVKLAVMPKSKADVLSLLTVTRRVCDLFPETPVITMSMGELGKPSRYLNELSGSAVTFAANKKASAPGQMPVDELIHILDVSEG